MAKNVDIFTSFYEPWMSFMASQMVNPFQRVFNWLCSDLSEGSLSMPAIASQNIFLLSLIKFFKILIGGYFLYNIVMVFAIPQRESATGARVSPILKPPSHPTPTLWVVPEHWLWVPCFMHQTCTGHLFTYGNIHVSKLFSQIIPPLPSSTESKSLIFKSVSPLLPCM